MLNMKAKLHIANTFLERELENPFKANENPSLAMMQCLQQNPVFLQLQFLPFLYAEEGDAILLSNPPDESYAAIRKRYGLPDLKVVYIEDASIPPGLTLEPWGASELLARWAATKHLNADMPAWESVRSVNSKAFSFVHSPKLSNAALLHNRDEARLWLETTTGPRVFKTCFGLSGRGHLIIDTKDLSEKASAFLEREWKQKLPVIAEPWVKRVLDFSTQWMVGKDKSISFIGSTVCENDERGKYRANRVGNPHFLFGEHMSFLEKHKMIAIEILAKVAEKGYFGHAGIDAMIYEHPEDASLLLHPIVEINARKTMGWVSIAFQQKYHPDKIVEFCFLPTAEGLLPNAIELSNKNRISFSRNIQISIHSQ